MGGGKNFKVFSENDRIQVGDGSTMYVFFISLLLYVIGYELFRTNSNSFFRTSAKEVGAASRYDMIPIPKKF